MTGAASAPGNYAMMGRDMRLDSVHVADHRIAVMGGKQLAGVSTSSSAMRRRSVVRPSRQKLQDERR